jgi:hypothetical protein
MKAWLFREPTLCCGLPVYICAAVVFPFQLGWTGASLLGFGLYLVLAAGLFSVADVFEAPSFYPKWGYVVPQAFCSLLILAVPATLAFALAAAVAPIEEQMDDQVCLVRSGAGSSDTVAAEADDALDVTPDCVEAPDAG